MQACQVFSDQDEIAARLEQLSLEREPLREAINQAHLQRVRLTPNHPSIFPGLEMWGWLVGAVRDQLRPLGWVAHEQSNYPLTVHSALNLAIAVASGDSYVGNLLGMPSSRSRKGKNTVDAVERNCQFDMFDDLLPDPEELPESGPHETWILLHHTDTVKKSASSSHVHREWVKAARSISGLNASCLAPLLLMMISLRLPPQAVRISTSKFAVKARDRSCLIHNDLRSPVAGEV